MVTHRHEKYENMHSPQTMQMSTTFLPHVEQELKTVITTSAPQARRHCNMPVTDEQFQCPDKQNTFHKLKHLLHYCLSVDVSFRTSKLQHVHATPLEVIPLIVTLSEYR